ncbi:MAG: hypothetical protein JRJ85_23610, partial [Deltaproteobacteria bacterium]|nr:hypothetical protein [Deltaproteobacteria bacterium]
MRNTLAAIIAAVLISGFAMAEWRPEEAPKTVPGIEVPFAQKADPEVAREMRSLEWRCVGPFVGNRGCGVEMHPTDRNVFYHAHSSGGVWKTEDAGQYWIPITDGQINVGSVGAIAVSRSNPDIIYIGTGEPQLRDCVSWGDGAYKSTDGGETWKHIGLKETRHISRIRIHPEKPDLVYVAVIGNPFGPSKDRGIYRSKDGGKTWSTPFTQPTQQAYRLEVDNLFPYNLYGNNQDLIGYKVPSASIYGGISQAEVTVIGSGESGPSVPHPSKPDIVYHLAQSSFAAGGCPIQRVNLKTGQWEHRNVWPMPTFGEGQDNAKYRFNWHAPIVIDPFNEEIIYTAAEVVFRSKDEGMTWEVISPVLTKDDESKQQTGGSPSSLETSGQEAYNTIHRMVASRVKKGILWTGSDDGLVHVTQNGG